MSFLWCIFMFACITAGLLQIGGAARCAKLSPNSKARIAVGFYGISRNLSHVAYTFKNHVFDVLDREHIVYDVFSVTMGTSNIVPTRGSTTQLGPLDPFDIQLLEPCHFSILSQEKVQLHEFSLFKSARGMSQRNLTLYKHFDIFEDKFESIKNVLCSYHTLRELGAAINAHEQAHHFKYDALLVMRPDTAIVRDIDLPENLDAIRQDNRTIWLPDFQHNGGYNDRLAYGSLPAMAVYLHRGQQFRDAPGGHLVSEQLVKHVIVKHNITVKFTTERVLRVRQNGMVAEVQRSMNIAEDEWRRCVENGVLSNKC